MNQRTQAGRGHSSTQKSKSFILKHALGEQQHELEVLRHSLVAVKEEVASQWYRMYHRLLKLRSLLDDIECDWYDSLDQIHGLIEDHCESRSNR